MTTVGAEMGRNGWMWAHAGGGGECDVKLRLPERLGTVTWELDPAFPAPDPESTEIHLLVTEQACASGQHMGDRMLGPQVAETDDAVRVAFAAITIGGDCPSNPATPVTITLDAPLGSRDLRDGLTIAPLAELAPSSP